MTERSTSQSHYERDPRVPPLHLEHLRRPSPGAAAGLPRNAVRSAPAHEADAGPTYDDFLDHDHEDGADEVG